MTRAATRAAKRQSARESSSQVAAPPRIQYQLLSSQSPVVAHSVFRTNQRAYTHNMKNIKSLEAPIAALTYRSVGTLHSERLRFAIPVCGKAIAFFFLHGLQHEET